MNTLDRYLLRRFFGTYLASLLCFILIFNLVNLVERIGRFIESGAALIDVFMYYVYFTPFIVVLSCPVATLLAAIFSVGLLARTNELTAMKAAGVSLYRMTLPLIAGGIVIAGFLWVFGELVMPEANHRKNIIKLEKIEKKRTSSSKVHRNQMFQGLEGRIFLFGNYITKSATGENVVIQTFRGNNLESLVTIKQLFWEDSVWVGREVEIKEFSDFATDPEPIKTRYEKQIYFWELDEKPNYFDSWFTRQDVMSMGYFKLRTFIEVSRAIGRDVTAEVVDLQNKIAFPFINVIIILIGVSLASNPRRSGVAISFGLSMGISFVFFTIVKIAIELGHQGTIPPLVAAWGVNVLFLLLGIYLIIKTPK